MATNDVRYRCSFCEKDQDAVKRLIAGPHGVFICNECVTLATEILRDTGEGSSDSQ
jgi:ATP-dependent Clp protease ATP-binding subunit ClpX